MQHKEKEMAARSHLDRHLCRYMLQVIVNSSIKIICMLVFTSMIM